MKMIIGKLMTGGFYALIAVILIFVLVVSPVPGSVVAGPSDLDPSYGTGGRLVINFGGHDPLGNVALQADGKTVAVGSTGSVSSHDFALARVKADGTLDTLFGGTGKVTLDFGGNDVGDDVAIQADGAIVAVGATTTGGNFYQWAIARFTATGNLDLTFGSGGKVITDFGSYDEAKAVIVQPDGLIVVGGIVNDFQFGLARYLPNGSLDPTFGTSGTTISNFGQLLALARQSDGKLVATGYTSGLNVVVARYNANGTLDPTFGGGSGMVTTDFGGTDIGRRVAIQSDGKIVVAVDTTTGTFALARYNTNGDLDTTFGGTGKVTTSFGDAANTYGLAIQSDGKIVAVGLSTPSGGNAASQHLVAARYLSTGSLDGSFGTGGKLALTNSGELGVGVLIQTDGKIVLGGTANLGDAAQDDFLLVRLLGDAATMIPTATPTGTPTATPLVVPTDKDQCKDGGWRTLVDPRTGQPFRNQGQCVSFFETQGR